jgi:hypothetical protein
MAHDDDLYDITVTTFDDVTRFRHPTSDNQDEDYFRLYDAEAETLVYTTTAENGADETVGMALRDAADYAASDTSESE